MIRLAYLMLQDNLTEVTDTHAVRFQTSQMQLDQLSESSIERAASSTDV